MAVLEKLRNTPSQQNWQAHGNTKHENSKAKQRTNTERKSATAQTMNIGLTHHPQKIAGDDWTKYGFDCKVPRSPVPTLIVTGSTGSFPK